MPYSNPKQAKAIFLNIKRRRGMAAAKAFGRKHAEDMAKDGGQKPYKSRAKRKKGKPKHKAMAGGMY